ncbi:MAG: HAD-IA family hydrolase [Mailhella sp.]|nr:HAD-IA family hydrolase [Mailhella sp.]MBQ3171351.1 HAD-IA family hydrolase [Mailhella sp.]MBQ4326416.1 HAD-IA family hydrolase [Mailhella sp.]
MNSLQHPRDAEYIFLDLDGTLTDPSLGIINATLQALEYFGIHESDREKLGDFIGPPLYVSFAKHYGFSREQSQKAIEVFQDYYAPKGLYENTPYPGMRELLAGWKAEGRRLVLATSKPEIFAMQILERFGMASSFTFIAGGDPCETRVHKSDVIRYALRKLGLDANIPAVMVGDTKYDILGAKELGFPTVAVTYGFGKREDIVEAGAAWIVDSVEELGALMKR